MTYRNREDSEYLGQPLTVIKFFSEYKEYYYTPNDESILFQGNTYIHIPIDLSNFEQTNEINKNDINITKVPLDADIIELYRVTPPDYIINVLISIFHEGDSESIIAWGGTIVNINFKETSANIICESMITTIRKPLLKRNYQTSCPHTLYSSGPGMCNANKDTFVNTITGFTLASGNKEISHSLFTTLGNTYFTLGYVVFDDGETTQYRDIISHVGDTITINFPFDNLDTSDSITLYPGCNKTIDTCSGKFSNLDNYGGFAFIPKKNPFINTVF